MLCSHYWDHHHHLFVECWTKCWDVNSARFSSRLRLLFYRTASLLLHWLNRNYLSRFGIFIAATTTLCLLWEFTRSFLLQNSFSLWRLNLLLENSINYHNWISIPMNLKNERAIKKIVFTDRLWNLSAFSTVSHSPLSPLGRSYNNNAAILIDW